MSSTRHAADGSFHQERYASVSEFQHGLVANLVAKRTAQSDIKADRQLIWFIQYLSLLSGGLEPSLQPCLSDSRTDSERQRWFPPVKALASHTRLMKSGKFERKCQSAWKNLFPFCGELTSWDKQRFQINRIAARYKVLDAMRAMESYEAIMTDHGGDTAREELRLAEAESHEIEAEKAAALVKFPDAYPVENFLAHCREAAERGGKGWRRFS